MHNSQLAIPTMKTMTKLSSVVYCQDKPASLNCMIQQLNSLDMQGENERTRVVEVVVTEYVT